MKSYIFDESSTAEVVILATALKSTQLYRYYLQPHNLLSGFMAVELYKEPGKKKTKVKVLDEFIKDVMQSLPSTISYILCTDSDYFKQLTGVSSSELYLGYVLDSKYGNQKVIYSPSYTTLFNDPIKVGQKITTAMETLIAHKTGNHIAPGIGITHSASYPRTAEDIEAALEKLLAMGKPLTCDIEAFSLKHYKAGIGTIAFAWSKHEGMAFPVDYTQTNETSIKVRVLLKSFFKKFKNRIIFHNISFDATVLIYQLYMEDLLDQKGLHEGLETILRDWDDTKIISYLATNSCAGNELSLKKQAQEFAGNYAIDEIKDITQIPIDKLLTYNLVDALSTWHVFDKNNPTMINDDQENVYKTIFKPAIVDIIQMQLSGVPLNMNTVLSVESQLQAEADVAMQKIRSSVLVQEVEHSLNEDWVIWKNTQLKVKRVTIDDAKEIFNPGSSIHLQKLLFNQLSLPVLEHTPSGQPSTGGEIILGLVNHTTDPKAKELLKALVDYKAVEKILSTFIPAFKEAPKAKDGWHYLFGNFNIGGTVSGRLSSSNPNLQNLPANSKYGKLIKTCFEAPPGYLFTGLDFASLEDRISALTTKDPNKLKVYTDNYDGHCLRAYSYFEDQMPDIDPNSVVSINSIASKYKTLRQDSKAPTFALTYQGTWSTLVKNCGFTEQIAKQIEGRYHELYKVSDDWIKVKLDKASIDGYVTAAFGLRVRTPRLAQVIRGTSRTPKEAEAEGRTAGNALGQSWCLLNTRAASEFLSLVRKSEFKYQIRPVLQIHDAQYYLIPDDIDVLMYINKHLVEAVKWNNHPDIYHPDVGLGGEVSLFYPNWSKEMTIPNDISKEDFLQLVSKTYGEMKSET